MKGKWEMKNIFSYRNAFERTVKYYQPRDDDGQRSGDIKNESLKLIENVSYDEKVKMIDLIIEKADKEHGKKFKERISAYLKLNRKEIVDEGLETISFLFRERLDKYECFDGEFYMYFSIPLYGEIRKRFLVPIEDKIAKNDASERRFIEAFLSERDDFEGFQL
ncbi:MAG: hypothetical protein LBK50_02905 [Candidatus Nomurabacteria bacterium]|nr:hypothetical protein [Candidatus Nomurabacteria bacterium]